MVVVLLFLRLPIDDNVSAMPLMQRVKQLDLVGASLLIPAIICLILALKWGGNIYPWNSSRIIGLFVGFGLLAILFAGSQIYSGERDQRSGKVGKSARATLPPSILKQRTIWSAALFAFFFSGGFFCLVYYVPIYFQSVKGSSAMTSGLRVLPFMLGTVVSSVVMGALVTAVGYYTPFLIISTALATIGAGLVTYTASTFLAANGSDTKLWSALASVLVFKSR